MEQCALLNLFVAGQGKRCRQCVDILVVPQLTTPKLAIDAKLTHESAAHSLRYMQKHIGWSVDHFTMHSLVTEAEICNCQAAGMCTKPAGLMPTA